MGDMFDLGLLLRRVDGDEALARRLITVFLRTGPESMARIRQAINDGDQRSLESSVHALNNSVGVIAAGAVFDAVVTLEEMAGGGDWTEMRTAFSHLEQLFGPLLTELENAQTG